MSSYEQDIVKVTGCGPEDAVMIEYIMREEIFHGTPDWQTAAQFNRAARQAAKMVAADREVYEEFFRLGPEAFPRPQAENQGRG
jgi:hypothetical protein